VTATLTGQAVMEGFMSWRMAPVLRRLVTRGIAILPAAGVTVLLGEAAAGKLLIGSQVILSLALPFAVVPLIHLTASRSRLGSLVAPRWLTITTGVIAALLIALNFKLVWDVVMGAP